MEPIDNVAHAISQATKEHLDLSRLVVTAWRRTTLDKLGAAVVDAFGFSEPPELTVDDVIRGAIAATPTQLISTHTRDKRRALDPEDAGICETEYVALIARACETRSETFLRQARHQVHAAIALALAARLDNESLEHRYRHTPLKCALSFVYEVAQYYADYKEQSGLLDIADLFLTDLEPIEACALCLIDRDGMPILAVQALRRLLPRAFFCTVSAEA